MHIEIKRQSGGRVIEIFLPIRGKVTADNALLMFPLEEAARDTFSPKLSVSNNEHCSGFVSGAILAGGILYMLRSIVSITEQPHSTPDFASIGGGDYLPYRLDFHFKHLLMRRVAGLIQEVLDEIRSQDTSEHQQSFCSNTYTAAGILYFEVNYFLKSCHNESPVSIAAALACDLRTNHCRCLLICMAFSLTGLSLSVRN